MFRRGCQRLSVIAWILFICAALATGCGKSVLVGSENYHGFTPDSLRTHGAVVVGVGNQVEKMRRPDLLTSKFHERVSYKNSEVWGTTPFEIRSSMGPNEYEKLLNEFVKNGKLSGDKVLRIAGLGFDSRYAVLGRLLSDELWYNRESTEEKVIDEFSHEFKTVPGYEYQIERKIKVEVVVYDLRTGFMVWKGRRDAGEKANKFQEDVRAGWEKEAEEEQSENGGFWGCLSIFDFIFGGSSTTIPDSDELERYPDPPGLERVASGIFDDFAEDLLGDNG